MADFPLCIGSAHPVMADSSHPISCMGNHQPHHCYVHGVLCLVLGLQLITLYLNRFCGNLSATTYTHTG